MRRLALERCKEFDWVNIVDSSDSDHFASLVWFSNFPERMARMVTAWDKHLVERRVPALLPPILKSSGFLVEDIRPIAICDHHLKPDGLANMRMILMENYAVYNGYMSQEEAREWAEEQLALAAIGSFFFSVTHFVVRSAKL
ncbi:MAG: hypothetical protein WBC90_04490 [Albidovulum sp.]